MDSGPSHSGHSYFGTVTSAQEAHAILEACKLGLLPRVTRRLTDEERVRFVRAGAVFVWEEEEAGIRRWTDHIKWSPSRVSGAFLTYTEVPARGVDTLVKQSFSSVDANGTKMHLIAYTSKSTAVTSRLPNAARDPLIQHMLTQRTSAGRDPRNRLAAGAIATAPPIRPPDPASQPSLPAIPPPRHPRRSPLHHSHPSRLEYDSVSRPQTASSSEDSRPQTSVSEPQPQTSLAGQTSSGVPFPTPAHHSVASAPPSVGAYPAAHSFPPSDKNSSQWLHAHGAEHYHHPPPQPRFSSHYATPSSSHHSSFSPAPGWPSSTAPSTATATATTASPFDHSPRELPPLEQPVGLPAPAGQSSSQGVFSDDEVRGADGEWRPPTRQAGRGAEDERQLRLLGRSI
ncbi:hypothetical protein JCM3770_002710 [Rhodotorula araucariae]